MSKNNFLKNKNKTQIKLNRNICWKYLKRKEKVILAENNNNNNNKFSNIISIQTKI